MSEILEQHKHLARAAGYTPGEARLLLEDPRAKRYLDFLLKQLEAYLAARARRAEILKLAEQGLTQREIGEALGISQPRIAQLIKG